MPMHDSTEPVVLTEGFRVLLERNPPEALDAFFDVVACDVSLEGSEAKAHCYVLTCGPNKLPRTGDLARLVASHIINFALPRSEINKALSTHSGIISGKAAADLFLKAKHLFTRLKKSGEGGEVLLALMAETYLRLPQLFCKMNLKTNTDMHIHGADGIHASVSEQSGQLALHWGESKLYADPNAAIRECIKSLAEFLTNTGGSQAPQERDLQLMRDGLDLEDQELTAALKRYLDPDDPLFRQLEYRGLCLVGYDESSYPSLSNPRKLEQVISDVKGSFERHRARLLKKIVDHKLQALSINVFCLPLPSVTEFRKAFHEELGIYHGDK